MRGWWALCCSLLAVPALAADPLPAAEAAAWLQRMADASRRLPYEGIFVMQQGDRLQTLQVENHPAGLGKESRLVVLDGQPREVFCTGTGSVSMDLAVKGTRFERRLGSRHFPDLLPEHAADLATWYSVRLGDSARVGGQACRQVELMPKDMFRWGYILCADATTGLPLKATVVDENRRPLLRYAFVKVRQGGSGRLSKQFPAIRGNPGVARQVEDSAVEVSQLPPGFVQVAAIKRRLNHRASEVEHWVFSDGLTYISLFVEPAPRKAVNMKGQSSRGMVNLLTRQVGRQQVTVLGDAPWPAVEFIARGVSEK